MKLPAALCLLFLPAPLAAQDGLGLSISGETRMGVAWDRPAAPPGSNRAEARIIARTELRLKFVGETDGGLRFGAQIDLDQLAAGSGTRGQRVFLKH
jgi:hypothetical protein